MDFSKFDLLGKNIDKNTPFFTGLLGAHSAIKRFFGFKDIALPIIQSNNVKAVLRQQIGVDTNNGDHYPYAYMSLTNFEMVIDEQAVKTVKRHSQGHRDDGTNSTITKFYGFPMIVTLELHFVTNDIFDAVKFALKSLTLLNTGTLNFDVQDENFAWKVVVKGDSNSISFPRTDKDNESDPEAFDMTCTVTVRLWSGNFKAVPKINNAGAVQRQVGVAVSKPAMNEIINGIIQPGGNVIFDDEGLDDA